MSMNNTTSTVLDPFFQSFLDEKAANDLHHKSLYNYRRTFTLLQGWCDENKIKPMKLTAEQAREWSKSIKGNFHPATHSRHVVNVNALYGHAQRSGRIKLNPAHKLADTVSKIREKEPHFYSPQECRSIISACETEQETLMIYALLLTGMRAFELRKLKFQKGNGDTYIDWEANQIVCRGKGDKIRLIPIHSILREKLDEAARTATHGSVFVSSWGRTISGQTWQNYVAAIIERAGVTLPDHPSHSFRKTLTTSLVRQNVRTDVVDSILGWSSSTVRGKYYMGRVAEDAQAAIQLAYVDDPVLPQQSHIVVKTGKLDEVEVLRLKLAILEAENEKLRLQAALA